MQTENTFIRDPSPTYSDEEDNVISATLQLGVGANHMQTTNNNNAHNNFLDEKFNSVYNDMSYDSKPLKPEQNSFAFWTIICILFLLCIGNLILTITIMGVLRFGRGIHGMELIPEEDVIKFYGNTDLDRIYTKNSGQIEGFADIPVTIESDAAATTTTAGDSSEGGGVYIRLHRNGAWTNRLSMDKAGVQFRGINSFEVKDSMNGANLFTVHRPHYNMPGGANALITKLISASRIVSPLTKPLTFEVDGKVAIKGSEGIIIDGFSALIQAEHNININSTQGATILEAGGGIYLDMNKIPIVSSEFGLRTGNVQYKLCVCMPQGTVFQIAIPRTNIHNGPKISCLHFNSKHDPCAVN